MSNYSSTHVSALCCSKYYSYFATFFDAIITTDIEAIFPAIVTAVVLSFCAAFK